MAILQFGGTAIKGSANVITVGVGLARRDLDESCTATVVITTLARERWTPTYYAICCVSSSKYKKKMQNVLTRGLDSSPHVMP
jgi:hypothetical protein